MRVFTEDRLRPAGRIVGGARRFLTTGKPGAQHSLVETFWGGPLSFEAA